MGQYEITKDLQNPGIFEIRDRVGHYCKLRVEPTYIDNSFQEHIYYTQIFNKRQLSILSDGFIKDWFVPRHSIGETLIEKISEAEDKLQVLKEFKE